MHQLHITSTVSLEGRGVIERPFPTTNAGNVHLFPTLQLPVSVVQKLLALHASCTAHPARTKAIRLEPSLTRYYLVRGSFLAHLIKEKNHALLLTLDNKVADLTFWEEVLKKILSEREREELGSSLQPYLGSYLIPNDVFYRSSRIDARDDQDDDLSLPHRDPGEKLSKEQLMLEDKILSDIRRPPTPLVMQLMQERRAIVPTPPPPPPTPTLVNTPQFPNSPMPASPTTSITTSPTPSSTSNESPNNHVLRDQVDTAIRDLEEILQSEEEDSDEDYIVYSDDEGGHYMVRRRPSPPSPQPIRMRCTDFRTLQDYTDYTEATGLHPNNHRYAGNFDEISEDDEFWLLDHFDTMELNAYEIEINECEERKQVVRSYEKTRYAIRTLTPPPNQTIKFQSQPERKFLWDSWNNQSNPLLQPKPLPPRGTFLKRARFRPTTVGDGSILGSANSEAETQVNWEEEVTKKRKIC